MTTYAYIRVSTEGKGQTTDNQRKQIIDNGFAVDEFFSEDGVSGSVQAMKRPAFARLMAKAASGDTIICTMVDRLGRTASDILNVVEEMKRLGIKLRVMQFDGIDITSSMGKMIMTCMAAMAELERNLLIERTVAGLARTKEQGTKLGAPMTITPAVLRELVAKKANGATLDKLQAEFNVPRNTIHRNLKAWGEKLEEYEVEWEVRKNQYAAKAA